MSLDPNMIPRNYLACKTLVAGKYAFVMPPNATDKTFIFDFIIEGPPNVANTNFADLNLSDWGC